ncbi:amino acid permease [Haloarcula rubripromontorii]|uniref:amino acid permease n=1 Tax=Haloarcula rubripromontorii TaxID=1705562 RepID=UPI00345BD3C8
MFWMCTRCGTVHTQNPNESRECTATTFEPVAESNLQSSSSTSPDALDDTETQTYGTTPDPEFESSPDVAVDGSIEASQNETLPDHNETNRSELTATARRVYHTVRATVLAPVALFSQYLLPILAFATVVIIVFWLLS